MVSLTRTKEQLLAAAGTANTDEIPSCQVPAEVRLHAPWPPSVNRYWRRSPHGGMFVSEAGRHYKSSLAVMARINNWFSGGPMEGPVAMDLLCQPPDRRKHDIDNVLKATLDALTFAGAWNDDSQVKALTVRMLAPRKPGGLDICIREISEAENGL